MECSEKGEVMEFIIERDVPMPEASVNKAVLATLEAMEAGDSILVSHNLRKSLGTRFLILRPKKFMTRKVDAEHARVWRVS